MANINEEIDDGYMTEEEEIIIDEDFLEREDEFIRKVFQPNTVISTDENVFKKYSLYRVFELIQFVEEEAMKVSKNEKTVNPKVWKQWEEFIVDILPDEPDTTIPKAKTTMTDQQKDALVSEAEWENHIRTYDIDFI